MVSPTATACISKALLLHSLFRPSGDFGSAIPNFPASWSRGRQCSRFSGNPTHAKASLWLQTTLVALVLPPWKKAVMALPSGRHICWQALMHSGANFLTCLTRPRLQKLRASSSTALFTSTASFDAAFLNCRACTAQAASSGEPLH